MKKPAAPRFGETPSKVWRPGEKSLQCREVFRETPSKAGRKAENALQGPEARRIRDLERYRERRAADFRAATGAEIAEVCFFTKRACPVARNCAFSVDAAGRREGRGRPSVSRWAMCRTAIECNLDAGHCQGCVRRKACNAGNGFRLFRCFRLERKTGAPTGAGGR